MTKTMKAMATSSYGPLQQLTQITLPVPNPGANQIRVRVIASALNPADYKVLTGSVKFLHARRFPMVLGYDFSGIVDEVGTGVTMLKKDDAVFGFLPYSPTNRRGAFAEYLVADVDQVAKKPPQVSHIDAASAATPGITALQSLRDKGRLKNSGATVLITGVSGGVGSLGVSIAKLMGASVVAVGSGKGLALATELGSKKVIDRTTGNVIAKCEDFFDVIFDAAAAYRWKTWKPRLKKGGTFVTTLPSMAFATDKLASLVASSRVEFINVKANTSDLEQVGQWLASGMPVHVGKTVSIKDVASGLESLMKNEVLGRVAVNVEGGF